jgi:hypothetical protein
MVINSKYQSSFDITDIIISYQKAKYTQNQDNKLEIGLENYN